MWWPESQHARFEMKSWFEPWSRSMSSILEQDTTLTDILLYYVGTGLIYPTS